MGKGRSRSRSPPIKKDKKSRKRSESSEDRKVSRKNSEKTKSKDDKSNRMETRGK